MHPILRQVTRPRQIQPSHLLIPFGLGLILLVVIPGLLALSLAFFHYDGVNTPQWVGGLNFSLVFTDSTFKLSLYNSLALVMLPVALRILWVLLLARLFTGPGRVLAWFRILPFLPSIVPHAALALAFMWIFNPLYGPVNTFLRQTGMFAPGWFADRSLALVTLALVGFWTVGEAYLCVLAALEDIPKELVEAARLDGANTDQIQRHVVIPLLAPLLVLLTLRDIAVTFQSSFLAANLITQGGPYYATYTLPQYALEQGFDLMSFGTASASLWVLGGLATALIFIIIWIAKSWQVELFDGWFR